MVKTWENAYRKMMEIKDEEKKLSMVLDDIWEENKIPDKHRINLFIGKASWSDTGAIFVKNMRTIYGEIINRNPYNLSFLRVHIPEDAIESGNENVVITVCVGRCQHSAEILDADTIMTYSQLGIQSDSYVNICKKIIDANFVPQYHDQLYKMIAEKTWPDEFSAFMAENAQLQEQKTSIEKEIKKAKDRKTNAEKDASTTEENAKKAKETYNKLSKRNSELEEQIDHLVKTVRFFAPSIADNIKLTAKAKCNSYQDFNSRLDYQYKESSVLPFLMALSTNQIITLYGPPGKGKTTFVSKMAKALGAKCTIISVQSNWTDNADLLGYYSPINKTYEATTFIDALICAYAEMVENGNKSRLHIICLDEMNLARIEYYFATFLSLLQLSEEERRIKLLPPYIEDELDEIAEAQIIQNPNAEHLDKSKLEKGQEYLSRLWKYHSFVLPPNVKFVGTINNDDTTNELSPKVKDRSIFIDLSANERSKDQKLTITEYFPLSFFEVSDAEEEELPKDFSEENNRFIAYSKTMLKWLRTRFPEYLDNNQDIKREIYSHLIITKILPALRKKDEFKYDEYPEANEVFTDRSETIPGEYFDLLGGY